MCVYVFFFVHITSRRTIEQTHKDFAFTVFVHISGHLTLLVGWAFMLSECFQHFIDVD